MPLSSAPAARLERALTSLEGLSVGDAFGERFLWSRELASTLIAQRALPAPPWPYTDDTEMALALVQVLEEHRRVDRDALAQLFAARFRRNPHRGYGGTAHFILREIGEGRPWREAASKAFNGQGSMGNGAAMRVAPLGAYFADDVGLAVLEARASAEVTHQHPEGQAGAIALAVAAVWACRQAEAQEPPHRLFDFVLDHTPLGATRQGLERARRLSLESAPTLAARELGSGLRVLSEDTVPFAVWCAARHLGDYEQALWSTVSGLGDCDTTCAMVGGLVALITGQASIPPAWVQAREPLARRL